MNCKGMPSPFLPGMHRQINTGNHECPTCRTPCGSRHSLRDDPLFDTLINSMYPDIDKYEEEEMLADAAGKTRNKKIQQEASNTSHRLGTDADDTSPVENDSTANESSSEDSGERIRQRRHRRRTGILPGSHGGSFPDSVMETRVETISPSPPVLNQEIFRWGRGGAGSNTQNRSGSGSRAE